MLRARVGALQWLLVGLLSGVALGGCPSFPEHLLHADGQVVYDVDARDGDGSSSALDGYASDGPLPLGAPCAVSPECASGHCVDDVCCDGACDALCSACDLTGQHGQCGLVPSGEDPHDDCLVEDPVATCGLDGTCDGAGACRHYPLGRTCKRGVCIPGGRISATSECDGQGTCVGPITRECFPYACDSISDTCFSTCTAANQDETCHSYYACDLSKSRCYDSCTSPAQCKPGNACDTDNNVCIVR